MLQWIFVGYLGLLEVFLVMSLRRSKTSNEEHHRQPNPITLPFIGLAAGVSSGLMGIGGGLAITAGLGTILRVAQHRAQAASLSLA
jgi:uncharacterized membrane protein YfcA